MEPRGAAAAFLSLLVIGVLAAASPRDLDGGSSLSGDVSDPVSPSFQSTAQLVFTTLPAAEAADQDGLLGEEEDDGGFDGEEGDGIPRSVRFCNRSSTFTLRTDCKPCALNARISCPPGLRQLTEGRGTPDCSFAQKLDFMSVIYIAGCRHTCEKTLTMAFCCSGFWGRKCQECPGGWQSPCGGHGRCGGGFYGNGSCACLPGFVGVACEHCEPNLYGPLCNKECQCVNGVCDNDINGTGQCDCNSGYKGKFCEESETNCDSLSCPDNSRCTSSKTAVQCTCNHGYEEDADKVCKPINRCLSDPSPCHPKAVCLPTGPATFECSCISGFDGDGFVCGVVDPCQKDFGGCPVDSTKCSFSGPGQRSCDCLEGFENYVEGDGCQLIDACVANRTLCHENANCTTTGPWEVECVCMAGYIGDGQNCYGNIYEQIRALHLSDPVFKNRFQYAVQLTSSIYTDSLTKHGPFTIFLSTDEGVRRSLTNRQLQDVFADKDVARQLIRQHLIAAQLTLADLTNTSAFYTLEGNSAELFYKNKELRFRLHDYSLRATVLKGDLIAANGIIHVIDQLLDKPPVTVGSAKKSIAFILATQPGFSRFFSLIKAVNLTERLAVDGSYTVFAPASISWSSLPQGTFDYFLTTEGKGKLIEILENHIVSGPYVLATDLINMPQITMMGGLANEISVSAVGRVQFNKAVNLTQADIHASNGYIHNIDGILLPDALLPILPHRCDVKTYWTVRGSCGICSSELKCQLITDVPLNETSSGCRYWVNLGHGTTQNYVAFPGCQRTCNRTIATPRCCDGFYGSTCHPCPGGFQKPCFGRGKCKDGVDGNGECTCDAAYVGASCEFCTNKTMYGPYCNNTCSCLHGACDNRVAGSIGICKRSSCEANYTGENCDVQLQFCDRRFRLNCHVFADCIRIDLRSLFMKKMRQKDVEDGMFGNLDRISLRNLRRMSKIRPKCKCRQGYQGPGTHCAEINPCSQYDRGGCHRQADCIKTGPGQNLCRCGKGWVGDGYYCYPSSSCENDDHCHEDAMCVKTISGAFVCACSDGYHGNGTYCIADNICSENNGGCHVNASCTSIGPGLSNCTCNSDLRGDGYDCYGSISHEIQYEPQLQHLSKFFKKMQFADDLDSLELNVTLLAPSSDALEEFLNSTPSTFWNEDFNLHALLNYHVISSIKSVNQLREDCSQKQTITTLSDDKNFELQCSLQDGNIYFNDARVISGDNPALNGLIHIIDKVLEPYSNPKELLGLSDVPKKYPVFLDFFSSLADIGLTDDIAAYSSFTLFVPLGFEQPTSNLKKTLSYYIVPSKLSTWKLKMFSGQRLPTTLGYNVHQQLTVAAANNQVFINTVEIVEPSNVAVSNGFMHTINGTLQPILNRCDLLTFDDQLEEQCCPGYFGISCEECPGGAENQCSSRGLCGDGIEGDGSCLCNEGYAGEACNVCVEESCRMDTCKFNNGGCHKFANCAVTDSGSSLCSCRAGYIGDGVRCQFVCDDGSNGGCPDNALCRLSENGEVQCLCPDGYEMIKGGCRYVANDCSISNGGCSPRGTCSQVEELGNNITCTCGEEFIGDGYVCFGDLWQTLSELTAISIFYKQLLRDGGYFVAELGDPITNWTAFIPSNTYLNSNFSLTEQELRGYFTNETVYLDPSYLKSNVLLSALNNDDLYISFTLQSGDQATYFVNGVAVIRANVPVKNGVLHILERPFEYIPSHQAPSANTQLQDSKVANPWLLTFLLVTGASFVIFVVAVVYRKRKNQVICVGRFPFFRFPDHRPPDSYNIVTFNPMVNYNQDENPDGFLTPDGIFPDFQQQESVGDRQQLI